VVVRRASPLYYRVGDVSNNPQTRMIHGRCLKPWSLQQIDEDTLAGPSHRVASDMPS
jgi:hypothetical protein